MSKKIPFSFIIVLGSMLFALFFGAGNLIFPPELGQMAGEKVWVANAGFLVTGVGLPLVAVVAFVFSGKKDLRSLAGRVHPIFGLLFAAALYLTIGPFFAMPRTGSVTFDIGVRPFLGEGYHPVALAVFTILFFGAAFLLSLNPSKIIGVIGKILTPALLVVIALLVAAAFFYPMASFQAANERYMTNTFFQGFQAGYLTLDALAAIIFGIIAVNAFKEHGVTARGQLMVVCIKAIAIAGVLLALIYTSLAYIGASSVGQLGLLSSGADVLAQTSSHYFGVYGSILLGLIIALACLTTCVGLITSCAAFFHSLVPQLSYKGIAAILFVFSALVANIGLSQLITVSVPVLMVLYPMVIALVILTFLHPLFKGRMAVYQGAMLMTLLVSLFDGLKAANIQIAPVERWFAQILPLYEVGLGWLLPAIVGGLAGAVIARLIGQKEASDLHEAPTDRSSDTSIQTGKSVSAGDGVR